MTDEELQQNVDEAMQNRPRRHNLWLNVIFLVGAIAGLIIYFNVDHETAKWILLGSLLFKFVELFLRIFKI